LGIIYGLLAAILWGGGDVLINRLTVHAGTTRALVLTQVLSLLFWIVYAVAYGFPGGKGMDPWMVAVVAGFFHVAGLVLTYRAFEIGTLSIVSPIASSFAIVTAVLALITGERPSAIALGGAALLVLGMIVVTRASSQDSNATLKGVPEALGSAIGFGVMFWLIPRSESVLGIAWPLVVLKTMAMLSAVTAMVFGKKAEETTAVLSRSQVWIFGIGVAVTDSLAWVCVIISQRASFVSIGTALASLFSVVTVVLAAVLLRERLNRVQFAGIAAIFAGILLVSIP
jgi:drug/metabolite transporter (DMT)-like permease